MKSDYTCSNEECLHEFEVTFTPATPDRYMNGRFEDAEQGSGAEASPSECNKCGEEVDLDKLDAL